MTGSQGRAVYTRWGRKDCPSTAELIYSVEPPCLPRDPQWAGYSGGNAYAGYVFGAEYEVHTTYALRSMHNHDVPCAVCETVSGSSVIVIPGKGVTYRLSVK
ncbi:uncharacterized protein LOC134260650 [Saccostrea cucullata]|uniref:uncharacterized protein LOC134260650 n=1 Tax=Saccostrea cuccullata TaxID=36930 RepID=UPI002ED5EDC2